MMKIVSISRVKKEHINEYIEIAKEFVACCNKEEGCLFFGIHQDIEDEQTFAFIEHFKDMKAIEMHRQMPHMQEYGPKMRALRETTPVTNVFNTLE